MSQRPRNRLPVAPGSLVAGETVVVGDDFHYLFRVRRLARGAAVELFDGAGLRARATVTRVDRDRAVLAVEAPVPTAVEAPLPMTALLALIKGERMDWAVQKLVELGCARVVPVRTARSVVKLAGERAAARQQRLAAIARDAARQSGRAVVPEVAPIADLGAAVAACDDPCRLIADEQERALGLSERLAEPAPRSVAFLIGPEGGFAPEERQRAADAGFQAVTLGPRILRAETAALVVAAALQQRWGDLGQAI